MGDEGSRRREHIAQERQVDDGALVRDDIVAEKATGHALRARQVRDRSIGRCEEGVPPREEQEVRPKLADARSGADPGDWIDGKDLLLQLQPHLSFSWLIPKVNLGFSFEAPSIFSQNGPGHVPLTNISVESAAYGAGLRNGMNYGKHEYDEKTKTVTVWIHDDNGNKKQITYSLP